MRFMTALLTLSALLLTARAADAHGINGHVWVTDGAVDYMRDCTAAAVLSADAIRPKLQIGAAFPDSGYATAEGRDYGETAHWEPFVESFVEYMRRTYAPPYDTPEEQALLAFVMGAASHGMEDETFDSIFMRLTEEKDGVSQEWLDPGTDFMLVAEHHTNLQPDIFLPADDLLRIFDDLPFDVSVNADVMDKGMNIVRVVVIGYASEKTDPAIDDEYRPALTWTAEHFLDPKIASSFPSEKTITGPYLDAIWHRLHGDYRLSDVVIATLPPPGERLASNDHTSAFSSINLVFGYGVYNRSLTTKTIRLRDAAGKAVPIDVRPTRWGGVGSIGRLVQILPKADLAPDADYTVTVEPGLELVSGRTVDTPLTFTFRTACPAGRTCEPLPAPAPTACSADAPAPKADSKDEGGCATADPAPLAAVLLWLAAVRVRRKIAARPVSE